MTEAEIKLRDVAAGDFALKLALEAGRRRIRLRVPGTARRPCPKLTVNASSPPTAC